MAHAANIRVWGISSCLLLLAFFPGTARAVQTTNIQGSAQPLDGNKPVRAMVVRWPAFTTSSNEQVPPGDLTATVGEDGRFAIDLVPNAHALPARTFYSVEYRSSDGSSRRELWLVPARPQVSLAEVRTLVAAAGPPQNEVQAVPADAERRPVDAHAEIQQLAGQGEKPRSQAPSLSHYTDSSKDHLSDFFHDPGKNSYSNQNDSWLEVCNYTSQQGWTGGTTGWTGSKNNCMNQFTFNAGPGVDLGTPRVGPGGWSSQIGINVNSIVNAPGISGILGGSQVKAGIGDTVGFYFYNYNYGGAVAGSDEGNHLTAALGGEQNSVYVGNIAHGGSGATSLKVRCTADCQYPGDGRYLIDTQQPVATGYVTGKTNPNGNYTPGTFTTDAAVTPSTAWGTLAADVVTPVAPQVGTGYTNMTFTVSVTHGRFTPGSLVCFGGQFHEQAVVSSVNGSNPATITVPLRHAHESGSWIMQGGPCGTFIEFTANTVTPGKQKIRYPVDILGATDAHTLVYRYFAYSSGTFASGYWAGNVTFVKMKASHLSNSGGTVTMTPAGGTVAQYPELYNAASVYISGATEPRFNGICTDTKVTPNGQLSCTQSESTGASAANAEVSYGPSAAGNTAFNLWSGAEVLDVLDHSISPPPVNGTFTLEPNSTPWNVNDTVENVHHYAASIDAQRLAVAIYNPMKLNGQARLLTLDGGGISGGNPAQPTFYAADRISNIEPATNYAYHGGSVTPPGGIFLGGNHNAGLFNYGLAMEYAPDPPGSSAFYIGCPASGCGDGAFNYNFATLQGNGSSTTFNYTPVTNVLSFTGKGLNVKNDPLLGTTLQSERSGTPASLNFSSIDLSGQAHALSLNAPLTGGGFSISLPPASGTLALNNAFGASGPNHASGMVPDPGPKPGTTRFLREDGKWVAICAEQEAAAPPSVRPAVLRIISDYDDGTPSVQGKFPAVVAKASLEAQTTSLDNFVSYVPRREGTFRVTVSVFIESGCDSGTLMVAGFLSPVMGHEISNAQRADCTAAYTNTTSTFTAHGAAGVPIRASVGFDAVSAGSLRYMVDAIVEQLQ